MKTILHSSAGIFSMFFLFVFFTATLVSEYFYSPQDVITVQQAILQAMLAYLFLILIAGAIGLSLSKERKGRLVDVKKKRMLAIIFFSVGVLLPVVYLLAGQTLESDRGIFFFYLEGIELGVCALIMVLLGLNARDGAKLTANGPTTS
ncbi:hypothetical protein [Polynucleobacter sp. UK-Gri1-W3]|uniref:hypothetical protein n=1 Tax=Polynucleobacter sp. UK-Gri1-W3 TaxID=1819737 RepID=UPI001C0B4A3E|nr:hypothetical protein [Polynucleobacter sp. UK-Gri1-W3]MBU3538657.1 hypothetical protein [Polynucleobacter sp. UK-Gri1-W3]